jgi:hypothetical protein
MPTGMPSFPAKGYVPEPGELRFDMYDAEFTHEGDLCTFEVLCQRLELTAPRLLAIAEIIHDIDVKDGKFDRPETAGVAAQRGQDETNDGISGYGRLRHGRLQEWIVGGDACAGPSRRRVGESDAGLGRTLCRSGAVRGFCSAVLGMELRNGRSG